jgi:hypothetical protein
MVKSKKQQLIFLLILLCSSVRVFGFDPNEIKIEFQFEESKEKQSWVIDLSAKQKGRGPIHPTHVAVLFVQRPHPGLPSAVDKIRRSILKTSTAQSISKRQQEFVVTSDDVKKMVQAYFEVRINAIRKYYQQMQTELEEYEQMATQYKSEISIKETELEAVEAKYQEIKSITHHSLSHSEAAKEASTSISEMNNILNLLNIELAGIRAKLQAIEKYKADNKVTVTGALIPVIEQIIIEQTIELASAEARKASTIEISRREQKCLNLSSQWASLEHELSRLRKKLNQTEKQIKSDKDRFGEAPWLEEIPKIYQEKVTVYPTFTPD